VIIPHKIHISWKTKDLLQSESRFVGNCIGRLVQLSPNWTVEISDDGDLDDYLRIKLDSSDYSRLKDCHPVVKSDVWRLIKLYEEGGLYVDIDRLCNASLDSVIDHEAMMVLPICAGRDFSHDFMCSAPGNPIFTTALELNLKRRAEGSNNTYFLGPQTYFHAVTINLLGEMVDINPGEQAFGLIRKRISECGFIQTYDEVPPYDTILYRSELNQIDHELGKRQFYKESKLKHWTGDW
jgi:hypothetical protein